MSRAHLPPEGPTVPERSFVKPHGAATWIDRVLCGKYAVEEVIGEGGMGIVLKARHLRLDEPVAIKVLHPALANDKSMSGRMLREARAALRLSSEHIVRVMDVDVTESGVPFLVMELLEGTDLATWMRSVGGAVPWEEAAGIAEQACRALEEAHAIGVVHRDLKPANLFLVARPGGRRLVKLLDFGISKVSAPREAPITRQGDILGSPRYMSPEQVRGEAIDGRSDLWALGVVLYEAIAGAPPFTGANFAQTCRSVLDDTPADLRALRPDVPPGLGAAVMRCLQKDPAARFQDASELRDALAPFAPLAMRAGSRASIDLRSAPPPAIQNQANSSLARPPSVQPPAADTTTLSGQITTIRAKNRAIWWIGGGLLVGIAVGAAVLTRTRNRHATNDDAPAPAFSASAAPVDPSAAPVDPSARAPTAPGSAPSGASAAPQTSATEPSKMGTEAPRAASPPASASQKIRTPKTPGTTTDPFGERRQ